MNPLVILFATTLVGNYCVWFDNDCNIVSGDCSILLEHPECFPSRLGAETGGSGDGRNGTVYPVPCNDGCTVYPFPVPCTDDGHFGCQLMNYHCPGKTTEIWVPSPDGRTMEKHCGVVTD